MTSKQECEWIKENQIVKWSKKPNKKLNWKKGKKVRSMHLWLNMHDVAFISSKVMSIIWVYHLQTSKLSTLESLWCCEELQQTLFMISLSTQYNLQG
jgi:uncharacterized protein YlbG (UPF0298 family)